MRHNITYTKYSINGKMNTILCCCTPLGVHELKFVLQKQMPVCR